MTLLLTIVFSLIMTEMQTEASWVGSFLGHNVFDEMCYSFLFQQEPTNWAWFSWQFEIAKSKEDWYNNCWINIQRWCCARCRYKSYRSRWKSSFCSQDIQVLFFFPFHIFIYLVSHFWIYRRSRLRINCKVYDTMACLKRNLKIMV